MGMYIARNALRSIYVRTNRRHLVSEPILEYIIKTAFPDLQDYLKKEEDVTMKVAKKREEQNNTPAPVPSPVAKFFGDKIEFQFQPEPDASMEQVVEQYVRVSVQSLPWSSCCSR
jgi:hypothetical protein